MKSPLMVVVVVLFCFPAVALAEIPQVMGYQGRITDNNGVAVADGTYAMRFRIYDAETSGAMLWDSANQAVALVGGIFNVMLGEGAQPAISLPFDQDYWLLVTFAGENQTPRKRLASVGYAYMASGLVPGTEVSGSVTTGTHAALKATNTAGSGTTYGVHGEAASTSGFGVYGTASAGSGYSYGGLFQTASTSGRAVGASASATTGTTYGVYALALSNVGRAVYGSASAGSGDTYGGRFETASTGGKGVYGWASAGTGTTYGVYGAAVSTSGYGVYYSGGFGGTGKMTSIVLTSKGPASLGMHTTAGDWVEDFGEGQLGSGRCHIELDPLFLETVTIDATDPMKVFVELHDELCEGVAVKKGLTGFDVVERKGGRSDGTFDYRVVAKRKGFEDRRLEYCKAAENDSYLYPELREKELQQYEQERARFELESLSNRAE